MSYPGSGEPNDPEESRPPPGPSSASGEQHGQPGHYGQPAQYGNQPGYPGQYGNQPGYPGQYGNQPGPPTGTNLLAILSLIFAFVFPPAGIVLGHLARRQIGRTGEQGGQLALWGLILSYIFTGLYLLGCCAWLALVGWAGSDGNGVAY